MTTILCLAFWGKIVLATEISVDYEAISTQIARDVEENHIPGMAVCVVDKDGVIFEETYGNCTSIEQPFIIGSMSKSFTAISIMQLQEQGRIDLDDSISQYIDASEWFINSTDSNEITIRELLNQTSGIDTYQTFGKLERTDSYGTHVYANANYGLLGLIIETVSGMSYEDYVTENIFNPLGMDNSAASLEKAKEKGLIEGYRNYFGIPVAGEADYPEAIHNGSWTNVPAGYISSSCSDMGKYLQMYLNDGEDIVNGESIKSVLYDNVPVNNGSYYYGMGWMYSEEMYSQPILWHAGLVENYTSNMFILPEEGIAVVVLVNMNDYLVTNNVIGNIVNPLIGEARNNLPNLYLILHGLIDIICVLLCTFSVYGILRTFRCKNKERILKATVLDLMVYILVPIILLCIPFMVNTPVSVLWLFVKDLCIVIYANATILILSGVCRVVHLAKRKSMHSKIEIQ